MLSIGYVKFARLAASGAALAQSLVLAGVTAGCSSGVTGAPEPASEALAENGTDVIDLASRLAAITASFVSSDEQPHLKLSTVRATTGAFYAPSQCLTPSSMSGSDALSVSFDHCDGPWGLESVTGALVVEQTGSELVFTGQGFQLGAAAVTFKAQANVTFDGAVRKMTWSANSLSGTTARGRVFTTSAVLRMSWQLGGTCIAANGETEGFVSGAPVSTEVDGLERCDAACPAVGRASIWALASLSTASPSSSTLSVDFTGMGVADFVVGGVSNPVQLSCSF
jgi:hypothetical protein